MYRLKYTPLLGILFLSLSILSVFNKALSGLFSLEAFKYLDEVLTVFNLIVIGLVLALSKKVSQIYFWVFGFLVYSILISLFFGLNQNFTDIVVQSFITIKFFVFLLSFFLLFKDRRNLLRKYFRAILVIAVIGLVLNLLMGIAFNEFFDLQVFRRPNKLVRYAGFLQPNHIGFLMAMNIGLVLNDRAQEGNPVLKRDWVIFVLSILVILIADSRSAVIGVVIMFLAFYWEALRRNGKVFLYFFLSIVIGFVFLFNYTNMYETLLNNLSKGFDLNGHYIRGIMANMAGQITYQYFPIGTGAATFGSVLSGDSPVYEHFGVANKIFFKEKIGIYDSSIASILGEYGFMGFVIFFAMFMRLKRYMVKHSIVHNSNMIIGLLITLFFYSLTNPILTNNIYILISISVFISFACSNLNNTTKN